MAIAARVTPGGDLSPYVRAELRSLFDSLPPQEALPDLVERRKQIAAAFTALAASNELPPDVVIAERWIDARDGSSLRVRTYQRPNADDRPLPALVWMHGGGFQVGCPEMDDSFCAHAAATIGGVVISVDYRLAPEHSFPLPFHDCLDALLWAVDASSGLGVDPSLVGVGGNSAGGALAAGVALACRDDRIVPLALQFLVYPILDDRHRTSSSVDITDARVWNNERSRIGWSAYLGDHRDAPTSHAVPSRAESLGGLPPTYILVPQLDLCRDEAIEYAQRLMVAGVPTDLRVVSGTFHGFDRLAADADVSKSTFDEFLSILRYRLTRHD